MYLAQHHTERINVLDATGPIESLQKNIWRLVQEERAYDVSHANHVDQ
jgi:hypothetical protein